MHPVKEKIEQFSQEYGLFQKGDRILVAVSGGIDSVTLLHVLSEPAWGLTLNAVYVHHGLRPEADEEGEWVRSYAKSLGVKAWVECVEVRRLAEERGESIQMTARNERYRVLKDVASKWGAKRIALGHHANDQAETVLLRLLTGTSPEGLGGMAPLRGKLIRPMLAVYRDEIMAYAKEHGLLWKEDRSNRDPHYLRNRVRLELIPYLTQIQPKIVEHLAQLALSAGEWREFLDKALKEQEEALEWQDQEECQSWSAPVWRGLPKPLQRAVLKRAFYRLFPAQRLENGHQLRIVRSFSRGQASGRIQLPGGAFISQQGQRIVLRNGEEMLSSIPTPDRIEVKAPGLTHWMDGVLEAQWIGREQLPENWQSVSLNEAYFADPPIGTKLYLRCRKNGDRMRVFGRTQPEKVKKLMIDAKVERSKRAHMPILVDQDDQIWWAIGLRHGQTARVQAHDHRILYLRYHPKGGCQIESVDEITERN